MKKQYILIISLLCLGIGTGKAQYAVLLNFDGTSNPQGTHPYSSLTISGKEIYGMTPTGGANDDGCIFSLDTNGNN